MTVAAESPPHSDLLAYALFELDPRAGSLRPPLLTFLVSVALFEFERPAYREEIFAACKEQFLTEDAVSLDQVEHAIASARRAGLFRDAGDGRVDLSPHRRDQLAGAVGRIVSQREAFHREIAESVDRQLNQPITAAEREQLKEALESFIQRLFQEHSVALARSFGPEGEGFDSSTADHLTGKSLESLARSVTGAAAGTKLRTAKVADGIREGLLELQGEGQKYLAAVYHKTIAFALLRQDPSVQKVRRSLVEKRVFYLDTNVAMSLLFSADPRHEHVRAAVDGAIEVGCALLVSTFTLNELQVQLEESNKRYERFHAHPPEFFAILDDVVLRTYAAQRRESPGLKWEAFYASCFPPAEALEELRIEISDADEPVARLDRRRDRVLRAVKDVKGPDAHPKVIACDADNILLVQARRKKLKADEMGRRVWLITLDHALKVIEHHLIANEVIDVQSSKQVADWAADLSFHLPPDDVDLGEYVLHMLQSQLRLLTEDPIFADVNFLSVLEESHFDIDELLRAKPAKTRRVLVALQERREIESLLADQPDEPRQRDVWAEKLVRIVQETLEKLDDVEGFEASLTKLQGERDEALEERLSTQREIDEWSERIEELERKIERGTLRDNDEASERRGIGRLVRWLTRA